MSYGETVGYLYGLQKYGIKFGLDNISRLMSALDNPHRSFFSVHVAGTNGKGSASAIIASILKTAGFKVGLFTSPHIVSFTERIRVNHEEITEDEVVRLAEEIRGIAGSSKDFSPTFFEVVTAMAFSYFKMKKIDIAVIEVGMGGRLDSTNIITPEVSVITSISHDHREFLGDTLKEISYEKAGIIKRGVPVVTSHQKPEAMEVIEKKAAENDDELHAYGKDFSSILKREDISEICFDYRSGDSFLMNDLVLPLAGEHQMENASVAIKAATIVLNKIRHISPHPPLTKGGMGGNNSSSFTHHLIREGLKNVRWPGRLEIIKEDPPILIDGAHNPAAAVVLSQALRRLSPGKYNGIILVLGIMNDKDVSGIMEPLLPLASEIIFCSPAYSRAASPEKLAGIAESLGFCNQRTAPTVRDAVAMAIEISQRSNNPYSPPHPPLGKGGQRGGEGINDPPLIVITGSFYTIGEAEEVLGQKSVLARLRE